MSEFAILAALFLGLPALLVGARVVWDTAADLAAHAEGEER